MTNCFWDGNAIQKREATNSLYQEGSKLGYITRNPGLFWDCLLAGVGRTGLGLITLDFAIMAFTFSPVFAAARLFIIQN